jgi:hypothetical protein
MFIDAEFFLDTDVLVYTCGSNEQTTEQALLTQGIEQEKRESACGRG